MSGSQISIDEARDLIEVLEHVVRPHDQRGGYRDRESRFTEAVGVDPLKYMTSGPSRGGYRPSNGGGAYLTRSDIQNGDFMPFWITEQDHATIRYQCRVLASAVALASGVLSILDTYTVGSGFTYRVEPQADGDSPALVAAVQAAIDADMEFNGFADGAFESEFNRRIETEGEAFVASYYDDEAIQCRWIEAEYLGVPGGYAEHLDDLMGINESTCWKYGVHRLTRDSQNPLGYYVAWTNTGGEYDYFPAKSIARARQFGSGLMYHAKRNVPPHVVRGMSSFFPVLRAVVEDAKLVRNMTVGGANQAAISWIENFAAKSEAAVTQIPGVKTIAGVTGGATTTYTREIEPGSVLGVNGKTFSPGPMGAERNAGFEVLAALSARRIGQRWQMPEFMIASDAGSTNYASALVAESPFVRSRQRDQRRLGADVKGVLWNCLAIRCDAGGQFRKFGIMSVNELKRRLRIVCTPPSITDRDQLEQAQANALKVEYGAMDAQDWKAQDPNGDPNPLAASVNAPKRLPKVTESKKRQVQRLLWDAIGG